QGDRGHAERADEGHAQESTRCRGSAKRFFVLLGQLPLSVRLAHVLVGPCRHVQRTSSLWVKRGTRTSRVMDFGMGMWLDQWRSGDWARRLVPAQGRRWESQPPIPRAKSTQAQFTHSTHDARVISSLAARLGTPMRYQSVAVHSFGIGAFVRTPELGSVLPLTRLWPLFTCVPARQPGR